jgi:glucose/arabinose dehydrogenase
MPGVNIIVGNDGSNDLMGGAGKDLIYGFDPNGPQGEASSITATRVASGLTQPLFAIAAPGDSQRLFVVEQTGAIKIVDLTSGQVLATPFLSTTVDSTGERGLLGMAFDPDYASNGFFYIYRTVPGATAHNEIERYHVSANPDIADPASATPILNIGNLGAGNHNGGWIGFGPDGYLYAAVGENAVRANAQSSANLLGKILRIDVHSDAFPADPERNYAIPADNMFAASAGADEIFALGLRNPFRDSFDRGTGDFFIADVGEASWEEIDIGQGGANYGWPLYEGPAGSGTVSAGALTAPIHSYDRSVGNVVIGGYVYRGPSEALQGQYFFADEGADKVFTLRLNGSAWIATDQTSHIAANVGAINIPTSFGEDAQGNLYIVDYDGEVFRLTPNVTSADQGDTLRGFAGDDMMFGGSGNDRLDGGAGKDTMTGGAGNDRFVVAPGTGADLITDFAAGAGSDDSIDLTAFAGIHELSDVLARTTQLGADALIDLGGGDTVTLQRVQKSGLHADDFVFAPLKTSFAAPANWTADDFGSDNTWHAGDFNGDGKADIFRYLAGTSGADMFLSNGSSFVHDHSWTPAGIGSDNTWHVGDFNGDGKADIFRYLAGSSGADMFLSDGTGFVHDQSWTPAGIGSDNTWHVGDFNGDGKADIFRYLAGSSGADMFLSNGSSFVHDQSWTPAGIGSDNTWYIGDFNGDGKADIFRYLAGSSGADMFLSNGSGFVHDQSWTPAGIGSDNTWHVGDFNGDGKADIFRYLAGSSGADMFLSNGTGFVHDGSWTSATFGSDNKWVVGDFNGDGTGDLLRQLAGHGADVLL